jgi:transcription initiation factor IIE alpha subunit
MNKKNIMVCSKCGSNIHEVEFTKGINHLTGDEWFETGWWCEKCEDEVEEVSKKQVKETTP